MLWSGVAAGVVYGLAFRILFSVNRWNDFFGVMTLAFLFAVPFVAGFLTVFLGDRDGSWSWPMKLFLPWVTASLTLGAALLLAWEGIICIVIWVPLFLVLSLLGGLAAVLVHRIARGRRARAAVAGCLMILPVVVAPLERAAPIADELRRVETSIEIEAPVEVVWREIARVRQIRARRTPLRLVARDRLPEAGRSDAVARRRGWRPPRFIRKRGRFFVETITAWEPDERLAFEIAADPASIPARALDPHVAVSGPYLNVLEGEYRIERLESAEEGRLRLHLTSRHRLSTRFNFYSGLWTDFILADTQRYILEALKRRCEAGG